MQRFFVLLVLTMMFAMTVPAMAQETPSVDVSDQVSVDGTVRIASVYSDGPGFIVIHQDNGSGSFGAVIGSRQVNDGLSLRVDVPIDASMATSTLYAMLHTDDSEMGEYEFGTVEGADGPVVADGAPIAPAFNVDVIGAMDQFVDGGSVTIANVTAQIDGFIVIHADMDGSFSKVVGSAPVSAGQNSDVVVEIDTMSATDVLWAMLHVDTGMPGEYEFGAVEGADGPVVVGNTVAVTPIWTVPNMRIADQIIMHGDGMDMMDDGMAPTLTAYSVLAEEDGFLVIHQEADGKPGPVVGVAPVSAGLNMNVEVELDSAMMTPRLWPMLHVDTGMPGEYEFGTVEGADGPVKVNDKVLTFGIDVAPSLQIIDQPVIEAMMGFGTHIYVEAALMDAQGWVAIHSSVDGAPGPVIATAPLVHGLNKRILVELDPADAGTQVFPMIHYDTGEMGTYEFGMVDGADSPVFVAENVMVGPINIMESMGMGDESMGDNSMGDDSMADDSMGDDDMADDSMGDDDMADDSMGDDNMADDSMGDDDSMADDSMGGEDMMNACTVSPLSGSVNLRAGASTDMDMAGTLSGSDSAMVVGQTMGSDGFVWWNLESGSWVRSDIVSETGDCDSVPMVNDM